MSEYKTQQQSRADKSYSAIQLFEDYWVYGQSTNDMGVSASVLEQNGIPLRDQADAHHYKAGNVQLVDLWDEYLSDFQKQIARELWTLRMEDVQNDQ